LAENNYSRWHPAVTNGKEKDADCYDKFEEGPVYIIALGTLVITYIIVSSLNDL
jgi:hypothetical protein